MKKIALMIVMLAVIPQFTSCKSDKKTTDEKVVDKKPVVEKKAAFSLKTAKNNVDWVAYKTTEKVAVKGQFKKVNITAGGEGESVKEAIHNTEFSIPVSSIFTSDTSRDFKIRKFFFGIMENTELLSGKLVIENDSLGYVDMKMNNVMQKLPFRYTINDKTFSLSATMDVNKWNAEKALASLNNECKDLHKGADGVSKTWEEVAVNISSTFE